MSVDLSTNYLGLKLRSPLVASAGPLTGEVDSLRALGDAGASAVVLPSLFQEQIEHESTQLQSLAEFQADVSAEGLSYLPALDDYNTGPDEYLQLIRDAKEAVAVPVIASLNGTHLHGWTQYARKLEEAGADAIELNVYRVVTDESHSATQVEDEYAELVAAVCQTVTVPTAVKLGPQFTALPSFAKRLEGSGAAGLVLFNRFLYPDIDLEELTVNPRLALSTSSESLAVIRWIAILRDIVKLSLAATSGVHNVEDAIKLLLVGADVTMMTSALLRRGPRYVQKMTDDLASWLESHDYDSVEQLRGSMTTNKSTDGSSFARANYMQALLSYSKPTGSTS